MALPPYSDDPHRPAAAAPSYFTAAALRAGYAVAAPPPPAAHRDALYRELHDERVGEDYFAREIARSRSLLDQRLLHPPPAPIYPPRTEFGPAPVPPQRVERLPYFLEAGVERQLGYVTTRTEFGPAPVPPQRVERLPYFLEAGVERQLGYARMPAVLRPEAVIRKQPPLVKRAVVPRAEGTLPQKLSGIKRKAATTKAVNDPPKLSGIKRKAATTEAVNDPPQKIKKWSCSLCQVFTTSEQDLKSHLQGQKHKAIQESRSSQSKVADKALRADWLKEVDKQLSTNIEKEFFFCDVCKLKCNSLTMLKSHLNGKKHKDSLCQAFTTNEQDLKSHLQGQKHKAIQESRNSQSKVADKSLPADGLKEVDEQLSTKIEKESLFCGVCKLKCNSLTMLKSHLSGKKHKEGLLSSQSEVQSFNCDDCKLKCNSLSNLKLHLNGKKHKEQLEELNKVQNDKPVTAEQSGKDSSPASVEGSGKESKAVNAAETKLASEKPATAEQSGD